STFNSTSHPHISPLSLHDALPISLAPGVTPSNLSPGGQSNTNFVANGTRNSTADVLLDGMSVTNVEQNSGITNLEYQPSVDEVRSEEHTSELQSHLNLVCRLLLEK